ncbi:MAG: DUF3237 family protein [Oscillospiraceae bacterium]|nr:DUF3237 family protein [Oscillospiraceae bacterium]
MSEQLNITRVDHLFSADVELESWGFYPNVSAGVRVNNIIKGGEVFDKEGNVVGEVVPGGEMNQLLRFNGVFDLEGRLTFKLSDGNLVYVPYEGRADFCKPEELDAFAKGELTAPLNIYMAVPVESTKDEINRMYAFAVGRLDDAKAPTKAMLDIYEFECMPI